MRIFINVLVIVGFALALFVRTKTLVIPHGEFHDDPGQCGLGLHDRNGGI